MRALGGELPERARLVDVLQALPAGVAGAERKVLLDALVERLAHADAAGRGFGLQMSGDVYAVAIDGAVGFLDDVAQMHADAHPHAPLFARRAFESLLHRERRLHRARRAIEECEHRVARHVDPEPRVRFGPTDKERARLFKRRAGSPGFVGQEPMPALPSRRW